MITGSITGLASTDSALEVKLLTARINQLETVLEKENSEKTRFFMSLEAEVEKERKYATGLVLFSIHLLCFISNAYKQQF